MVGVVEIEVKMSLFEYQTFQPLLRRNREAPTARASRGVWGHAGLRSLHNTGCSMETGQDIKDRKV